MLNINLFPWRELSFQYQQKILRRMLLASVLLGLTLNLIIHHVLSHEKTSAHQHVLALSETMKRSEEFVIANMNHVSLYFSLGELFAELGMNQDGNTCFISIEKANQSWVFTGQSRSVKELTDFLLHWKPAHLFSEVKLKFLENQNNEWLNFGLVAAR